MRKDSKASSLSLSLSATDQRPYEDTVKWQLSTNQEEGPHQETYWVHLDSWTSRLLDYGKIHVCCLGHPTCDILLWWLSRLILFVLVAVVVAAAVVWIASLYPLLPPQLVMIFIWLSTQSQTANVIQDGTNGSGIKNQHNSIPCPQQLFKELACD